MQSADYVSVHVVSISTSTAFPCCVFVFVTSQYCNIEALVKELGIPSPFTPFTSSSFWTPDGLQVGAAHSLRQHSMAQHSRAQHSTAHIKEQCVP